MERITSGRGEGLTALASNASRYCRGTSVGALRDQRQIRQGKGWVEGSRVLAESDTKWNRNSNSSQSRAERQQGGRGDELRELIILEGGRSVAPMFS